MKKDPDAVLPPDELTRAPKESKAKLRLRVWLRITHRCFTIAAIVIVAVLGWSVLTGMRRMMEPYPAPQEVMNKATQSDDSLHIASTFSLISNSGYWQMAGWQWQIGIRQVSDDSIDQLLNEIRRYPVPQELSDDESKTLNDLLISIHQLELLSEKQDDVRVYRSDSQQAKLRIVTRGEGPQEIIVSLGAALRSDKSGNWMLMELGSKPLRTSVSKQEFLLPMNCKTKRSCCKTDSRGIIQLEFLELENSLDSLPSFWRRNGWNVTPAPFGIEGQFNYLCQKSEQVIHAWSPDRSGVLRRLILVTMPLGSARSKQSAAQ